MGADWFRGEIARMRDELRLPGRALSAGVIVPLPLAARIVAVVEAAERLEYAIGQDDSEAARDAAESYRAATRGVRHAASSPGLSKTLQKKTTRNA